MRTLAIPGIRLPGLTKLLLSTPPDRRLAMSMCIWIDGVTSILGWFSSRIHELANVTPKNAHRYVLRIAATLSGIVV